MDHQSLKTSAMKSLSYENSNYLGTISMENSGEFYDIVQIILLSLPPPDNYDIFKL